MCSLLEAEVIVCWSRLSREEIYHACKFLYAGTCIKEHASSRSVVVVVLFGLLFWLTDWQNERVDQRYTEEGLLIAGVVIFSQLRLPNCLRTVLLFLLGLVLQQYEFNYSPSNYGSIKGETGLIGFTLLYIFQWPSRTRWSKKKKILEN